jgi:ATP-dependent Clp protease adapter protein ClpS
MRWCVHSAVRTPLPAPAPQVVNCEEGHARNCYATAQQLGMAMVVSCLKEHAEHYMQQLYRAGVRTAIEPDTSTA